MQIIKDISIKELQELAGNLFGDMIKAVIDIRQELVVVDAELHADEEEYLLEQGSKQEDLWGFNLYPEDFGTDDFIEFDSIINIRPRQNNRRRSVDNAEVREKIKSIVEEIVHE